jgi:serine/threonine protein phosphatase PrpC
MNPDSDIISWVCGRTDPGLVRKKNEDAFVVADLSGHAAAASAPPTGALHREFDTTHRGDEGYLKKCRVGEQGLLLAVSDGMGGAEAGELASFLVCESLRDELTTPKKSSTGTLVREAVERANSVVLDAAVENPKRTGMGATLTAALVRGDHAYVAGVGDSRCYVIRLNRIRQLTRDQSLVESLVELGHITREEAETSPHKNIILQALGTRPQVAVALSRLQLCRGDMLLLCSDGLSGKLNDEELKALALEGPTIEEACRRMIAVARDRGGEDNITVILSHFSGAGLPSPIDLGTVTGTLEKIHGFNHVTGSGYDDNDETQPHEEPYLGDLTTAPLNPPPEKE